MKIIAAEPLLEHIARCALGHPKGPGQVGVDDFFELFLAHPHEQHVGGNARVSHQDFDRALMLFDSFERGVDGVVVGDVTLDTEEPLGRAG